MKRIRRDAKRFKNCDCDEFFEVVEESPNYYLVQRADAPKGVLNAVHKYGYVEIKPNELREDEFPSEFRSEMSDECFEVLPEKPPLGLCPDYVWRANRQEEILEAVSRYVDAKKDIPYKWIAEYWELRKVTLK